MSQSPNSIITVWCVEESKVYIVTSQFIEIKKPIHYLKWNIMVEMVHVCGQILRPFLHFLINFLHQVIK